MNDILGREIHKGDILEHREHPLIKFEVVAVAGHGDGIKVLPTGKMSSLGVTGCRAPRWWNTRELHQKQYIVETPRVTLTRAEHRAAYRQTCLKAGQECPYPP